MLRLLTLAVCLVLAVAVTPNRTLGQSAGANNFAISFKNDCHFRIRTAIHYRDLSGNWVTNGWWTLNPGQTALVVYTTNQIYYIYAEPTGRGDFDWEGSDYFDHIRGSPNTYGFRERNMHMTTWGTFEQSFACHNFN